PNGLTREFLASKGLDRVPATGIHSVIVPGCVAGWETLRARFGTRPLSDLLAAAILYADEGFPLSDMIAAGWANWTDKLSGEPLAAETFMPGGRPPRAGELFRNRQLANTLRLIAKNGPAGFYEGKTAEAIVAISREK